MASRYGWPIALSLVAIAAVSIPGAPKAARQPARSAEHRRERVDRDSGRVRVPDGADVVLNTSRDVPLPGADGSFTSATQLVLPAAGVGTFYPLMVADADQVVTDTSEEDNLAARPRQLPGR